MAFSQPDPIHCSTVCPVEARSEPPLPRLMEQFVFHRHALDHRPFQQRVGVGRHRCGTQRPEVPAHDLGPPQPEALLHLIVDPRDPPLHVHRVKAVGDAAAAPDDAPPDRPWTSAAHRPSLGVSDGCPFASWLLSIASGLTGKSAGLPERILPYPVIGPPTTAPVSLISKRRNSRL